MSVVNLDSLGSIVDYAIVGVVVAFAIAFLVRGLVRGRPPPCHPARSASTASDGDVVVGASLARGLERAQARRQDAARSTSRA